jgi:MFS family permease
MTTGSLQLLRGNPDFGKYWCGQALSALGSSISGIALPLLILHVTNSVTSAGAVATVRLLVLNLARLPGGVFADRWHRRTVMVATDLVKAVIWTVPAILLANGTVHVVWPLLVVAAVDGVVSSVYNPSLTTALRRLIAPPQIMTAVSLNEARSYATGLAGPAIGGLLFAISPAIPFLVDGLTFTICAGLAATIRKDLGKGTQARTGMLSEIRVGLSYVLRQPFLRLLTLWSALLNFGTAAAFFGFIPLLRQDGYPASSIGLITGLISVGALVGAILTPRLVSRHPYRILTWAGALATAFTGVIATLPRLPVIAMGLALLAALGPVLVVLLTSQVYQVVPEDLMGRAQSSMLLMGSALYPFAALSMGFLLQQAGARWAYAMVAGCLLVCFATCTLHPIRAQLSSPEQYSQTLVLAPIEQPAEGPVEEALGAATPASPASRQPAA